MLVEISRHLPEGLKTNKAYRLLSSTYAYCVKFNPRQYLEGIYNGFQTRRFKDIHKGQRCFIIGNGPSILQQDLTKLRDEVTFVNNYFPAHPQYDEIKPTYYCHIDTKVFTGDKFDTRLYQLLLEKTRDTVKFFPLRFKPIVKKNNLFPNHTIFYVNNYGTKPIWKTGSMSTDASKVINYGGSVVIDIVLPLAFYMGFSDFYLLGCDCDYKLDQADDFSQGYFYGYSHRLDEDYQQWYDNWYKMVMTSYAIVKETLERHGRRIYNAGIGGKLEVFERVDYEQLV